MYETLVFSNFAGDAWPVGWPGTVWRSTPGTTIRSAADAPYHPAPGSSGRSNTSAAGTIADLRRTTITKSGDKYVLQDASGTTYDIDRQDLVKPHEGKRVRINGTLDPDGKTIHVK